MGPFSRGGAPTLLLTPAVPITTAGLACEEPRREVTGTYPSRQRPASLEGGGPSLEAPAPAIWLLSEVEGGAGPGPSVTPCIPSLRGPIAAADRVRQEGPRAGGTGGLRDVQ